MKNDGSQSADELITYLGESVPYQDGSEDALVATLRSVEDPSDGSDELLGHVVDWPTLYHLSPLRSNLLRPLRLEPGMRVLDVGCGSGPLLRYLGEQGLDVTGIEGTPARARAAAIRCADLPNVNIVCGPIQAFESEPFDLVLVIGVLEYAGRLHPAGHRGFLEAITRLTGDHGVLGLAIENQIGLKYLTGYNEDHLGLPWVGVEGYRRQEGIRTWSRRELAQLLGAAGLPEQRWLYPYPDYKLATHVFTDTLFRRPEGPGLVAKFLGNPVVDRTADPALACDPAGAHDVMLAAGLGEEVANSFFVLATAQLGRLETMVQPGDAWLFSKQRLRVWRRSRALRPSEQGYELVRFGPAREHPRRGWLQLQETAREAVRPGESLERVIARSLASGDVGRVQELLGLWWAYLLDAAAHVEQWYEPNPFLPPGANLVLPGHLLDANLDNFLLAGERLVQVDTELVAHPAVDAVWVATRALRYLAERAQRGGWIHPWIAGETLAEVHSILCDWAGVPSERPDLDSLAASEAQLQALVLGSDPEVVRKDAVELSRVPMFAPETGPAPLTTRLSNLQRAASEASLLAEEYRSVVARRDADLAELRAELDRRSVLLEQLQSRLESREAELEETRSALTNASARLEQEHERSAKLAATGDQLMAKVAQMESSRSWRLTRPLRGVRERIARWESDRN